MNMDKCAKCGKETKHNYDWYTATIINHKDNHIIGRSSIEISRLR